MLTSYIYRLIVRLYKILPFKRVLCMSLKILNLPIDKFYKELKFKGKFKVKVNDESFFLMFHYGGTIENETFWKGLFKSWESDAGWIWLQLCKCSDVVFDIGANTGIYSLLTKCINKNAEVYAFEPSINTIGKLRHNIELNNYNIRCEQLAVSDIDGEQIFYDLTDVNQTSASLSEEKNKKWEYFKGEIIEYKVRTMTLKKYIEDNEIRNIDLIKMDIEMHEPEAVKGMGKYLDLYKPIVLIEVLSDKVAEALNELIKDDFLIFHLKGAGNFESVSKFRAFPGGWNYLFFHKEKSSKIKQHTTLDW